MHLATTGGSERPLLTFVGAATLDALALVEQYPAADERVVASDLRFAGGGPAATAAVAASRLGHDVAFIGAVGADSTGDEIIAGLAREGVRTEAMVRVETAESGASVVVISRGTATRAISNRPLPRTDLVSSPAARALLAESTWIHTDHIGWEPTMRAVRDLGPGPRMSFDGGHLVDGFTPDGLDLYVPTVDALQRRLGRNPTPHLLEQAAAEFGGTVVATAGGEGAWTLERGGAPRRIPGFAVDVLSTLGAGDVFHGALLAQIAEDRPLDEAVRRANAVAALSTRALDGRSGIPDAGELDSFLSAQTTTDRQTATTSPIPEETR